MRVAVLMSGGVDSAGAALALKQRGDDVTGITAQLWATPAGTISDALYRASRICHSLDIPHIVLDLTCEFEQRVVGPFVQAYLGGRTPNPCAVCNRDIKMGVLMESALSFGFDRIATGHYAGIGDCVGHRVLCEPLDRAKSQTYFLALIRPQVLDLLEFPLSGVLKEDLRQSLADAGVPGSERESQDLCFAMSGTYRDVLRKWQPLPGAGDVLNTGGKVVGKHRGHWAYTVGQRYGLEGKRYYVVEKSSEDNKIVIAERQETYRRKIVARDINLFVPVGLVAPEEVQLKYRYNSPTVGAIIDEVKDGTVTFSTKQPCFVPAPGQVVACYVNNQLVCGGLVDVAE
jgi:tRNA-specific 2-thiouridylase